MDTICDRQTDRQTDVRGKTICLLTLKGGDITSLIDICMKFREDSLKGFQVTEWTRFVTDRRTEGCPGKNNMSPNPEGGRHN